MIPRDTTPEAWEVQTQIWRRMSGQEKIELAFEMSENVRQIAAAGVRQRHPGYSDDDVRLAVIRLTLGDALFHEVYPDCNVVP